MKQTTHRNMDASPKCNVMCKNQVTQNVYSESHMYKIQKLAKLYTAFMRYTDSKKYKEKQGNE